MRERSAQLAKRVRITLIGSMPRDISGLEGRHHDRAGTSRSRAWNRAYTQSSETRAPDSSARPQSSRKDVVNPLGSVLDTLIRAVRAGDCCLVRWATAPAPRICCSSRVE